MVISMYTASYNNIGSNNVNNMLVSISGDRGKKASYSGDYFSDLAPKKGFFDEWYNNIGKISEEDNMRFYIKEYYNQVLSKLDPEVILNDLKGKILLCYEDNMAFCHRHIIAFWIELFTGVVIPEIQVLANGKIKLLDRPTYLKSLVEEVIKSIIGVDINKSLESAYLLKKAETLENYAIKAMDDDDTGYSSQLSMLAQDIRSRAISIDKKYRKALMN